ncbi:MAG: Uncharacterised protein [Methanobacteriota archaeon]|nr:MAG: Uncharacterised protein [Euryarchaeota archaeon]
MMVFLTTTASDGPGDVAPIMNKAAAATTADHSTSMLQRKTMNVNNSLMTEYGLEKICVVS